ncbi:doublecortin domain-containing protein 2 isoform X2 [Anguilla rostrata]|uniref:doublecortin domain-containing protein 2 isoform X2 n=1 Tax=Anguilla rostrata TaxID=7938 RepID=UPI0030CC55BF
MSGTSGRKSLSQPPPAKTIVVYRNGDAFFPGRKFVLNQRQMSTFDSFLSLVTNGVEAPFGAVRNVYTPREGHKILDLQNLQHGERYVAAGAERFKKLDYFQITTKKPQRKKNLMIRPVVHSRIIVSARWRKIIHESCTIHVFTNGDVLVPPARVLIPRYTLRSWDGILALVTQKVHLRTGAVYRICTLEGTPLLGSAELENGQYYVAVGTERFRFLPYFHWVPTREVIRDNRQGVLSDSLPPLRKSKHAKEMSPEFRVRSLGDEVENPARGNLKKHADSYFHAKPERERPHKQASAVPHLLTAGEGGVFRAKGRRKEMAGATEVQEDRGMKADLPIDQTEAKVIEEEQCNHSKIHTRSGQQTPSEADPKQPETAGTLRPVSVGSRKISGSTSPSPSESGGVLRLSPGADTLPLPPAGMERETNEENGAVPSSNSPARRDSQNPLTDLQACAAETSEGTRPTSPESFSHAR